MVNKRYPWVDALKAFAILLVIAGHVLPWVMEKALNSHVLSYIMMLQMPLFMAISGYCSYKTVIGKDVVNKRFWQLVVPFLCWPIVWYIIRMDFSGITDYYFRLLLFPDTGLWFLFTLFLIIVIDYIRCCTTKKHNDTTYFISLLITESLLLIFLYLYKQIGGLGNWLNFVTLYYPYYSLGCIMRRNNELLMEYISWLGLSGGVIYAVGTIFFSGYLWQIILATGGILGCFLIFRTYFNRPLPKLVEFTGLSTLGIYAVHQPVIHYVKHKFITDPIWADVLITFIITYIISIITVWKLKKNKVSAFLFLGIPIMQNKKQ